MPLFPVVMAGGSGSRLWPLSRVLYPKQFLCLEGELTMLQATIHRLQGIVCKILSLFVMNSTALLLLSNFAR